MNRKLFTALTCGVCGMAIAAPASAQNEAQPSGELEDIVVTAQRREESLQKVPIAITAITASNLAKVGVLDSSSLAQVTPGLQITLTRNTLLTYLRGVGTSNSSVGEEASIATYIDGVYVAALTGATMAFNNIERIEVLKGPQGTLFGRNATGGLIHVITKDPSHDTMIKGTVGYANYNTLSGSVYATTGLNDKLAVDIAGYFSHQGEGWGRNISGVPGVDGEDVNYSREWAVRSKLLFTPTEMLKITLSGDYARRNGDIGQARVILPGAVGPGNTPFRGSIYDTQGNQPRLALTKNWGVGLKMEWDLDGPTLTSNTAYRYYFDTGNTDSDATPLAFVNNTLSYYTRTIQQELLLVGDVGRLDYTTGLYYFYSNARVDPQVLSSTLVPVQNLSRFARQTTNSYAAFGQVTYHLTDQTGFTAGLRYTKDKRAIDAQETTRAGYVGGIIGSSAALPRPVGSIIRNSASDPDIDQATYNKLTWRLALDHQFTNKVLGYASFSRGFKSGVFATLSAYDPPVNPETLDAYEIGLKSDLAGGRIRANLSAFLYDYKNIQLLASQVGQTRLLNAAKARIKGIEAEIIASPEVATGALQFRAAASYLDGKYRSFPNNDLTQRNPVTPLPVGGVCVGGVAPQPTGAPYTGTNTHCSGDSSGNDTIRTPPITLNISVDYKIPVGDAGDVGFNVSYYHNGGFYFEPDNRIKQPRYSLLNARIAFTAPDERWSVAAFANNITKEKYLVGYAQGLDDVATYGAPRTYGVTLGFKI